MILGSTAGQLHLQLWKCSPLDHLNNVKQYFDWTKMARLQRQVCTKNSEVIFQRLSMTSPSECTRFVKRQKCELFRLSANSHGSVPSSDYSVWDEWPIRLDKRLDGVITTYTPSVVGKTTDSTFAPGAFHLPMMQYVGLWFLQSSEVVHQTLLR